MRAALRAVRAQPRPAAWSWTSRSAELTKYAANAMLATRISFMNELALLAEQLGADIDAVRHGIGSDRRIGSQFLYAGCGYGGSCFPKDVQALARTAPSVGQPLPLLEAVDAANERQKLVAGRQGRARTSASDLAGKTIALWGLAFKPDTDDMREAPSQVDRRASWRGAARAIRAYDPVATAQARARARRRRRARVRRPARCDALRGRRRARHRHRVEGIPQPRLRGDARR